MTLDNLTVNELKFVHEEAIILGRQPSFYGEHAKQMPNKCPYFEPEYVKEEATTYLFTQIKS